MYAVQYALKNFVNDEENSTNDRIDAFVLYAWIGSLEATIDELVNLSVWASEFILESLRRYGPNLPNDSNFLMNYGDAVHSLQYQLEQFHSV